MNALDIIADACERLNLLSPGETLADDLKAWMLRRLNVLCDELRAQPPFLFKEVITSATQSGHITTGAGSWAAVVGQVVGLTQDGTPLRELTMQQYHSIYDRTQTGAPTEYARDGLTTIYLYPVPTGQTIAILHRVGASDFADLPTEYSASNGFEAYLGAALAVRAAPALKAGGLSADLVKAETRLHNAVMVFRPPIVNADSYTCGGEPYNILTG
jgi:hypothetical protein